MQNEVLPIELERKLAKLAAAADDQVRYNTPGSREKLKYAVEDADVQNWLVRHRMAGTAPHPTYEKLDSRR